MRPLGRTGIEVSVLGLGTVKLGRTDGLKYPSGFELPGDGRAREVTDAARALGMNLLDTAAAYGTSEQRLGKLIADRRDDWVIVTKAGEEFDEVGGSRFDFSPEGLRASVERSCRRLHTEIVDVVLIHSDGRDREVIESDGALDTLAGLRDAGRCRAIGMSTKTVEGARLAMDRGAQVLMVTLNLEDRSHLPVIREAGERGVGVLVKKGLASGHAAAGAGAADRVRASMDLVLNAPGVSSMVVGTINPEHLRANAEAAAAALGGRGA